MKSSNKKRTAEKIGIVVASAECSSPSTIKKKSVLLEASAADEQIR